MEVRLAQKVDIDAILALQTQIYRIDKVAQNSHETLEAQLSNPSCKVLVAIVDGKIIGTATIYFVDVAARGKPYALLEGLVTDKSQRGKGYGSQLFKKTIEIAKSKNCYKMIFTSGMDRAEAHKFYENLGFAKWGYEFRMDLD